MRRRSDDCGGAVRLDLDQAAYGREEHRQALLASEQLHASIGLGNVARDSGPKRDPIER